GAIVWLASDGTVLGSSGVAPGGPAWLHVLAEATAGSADPATSVALLDSAAAWTQDNWEYLAGAGLIGGGAAITLTGVGGPLGSVMLGGGLVGTGGSVATQKLTTGEVSWAQAAGSGVIDAATGGLGVVAALNPVLRVVVVTEIPRVGQFVPARSASATPAPSP